MRCSLERRSYTPSEMNLQCRSVDELRENKPLAFALSGVLAPSCLFLYRTLSVLALGQHASLKGFQIQRLHGPTAENRADNGIALIGSAAVSRPPSHALRSVPSFGLKPSDWISPSGADTANAMFALSFAFYRRSTSDVGVAARRLLWWRILQWG